jgi:hypothetical protein
VVSVCIGRIGVLGSFVVPFSFGSWLPAVASLPPIVENGIFGPQDRSSTVPAQGHHQRNDIARIGHGPDGTGVRPRRPFGLDDSISHVTAMTPTNVFSFDRKSLALAAVPTV